MTVDKLSIPQYLRIMVILALGDGGRRELGCGRGASRLNPLKTWIPDKRPGLAEGFARRSCGSHGRGIALPEVLLTMLTDLHSIHGN